MVFRVSEVVYHRFRKALTGLLWRLWWGAVLPVDFPHLCGMDAPTIKSEGLIFPKHQKRTAASPQTVLYIDIYLTLFEHEKFWCICGGDVILPHLPALPDTLFSRKTPKIPHLSGEIHSKPTLNDTKTGVKYRFGNPFGDTIGEWVLDIFGINRLLIF